MLQKVVENGYLCRLNKGELLVESLTGFCVKNQVVAGWVAGLGGVSSAEIGFYDLENKKYVFNKLTNLVELISLQGNIALLENKPFLHLHASFSDNEGKLYGGHLKEATIAGTCEIYITSFLEPLARKPDNATGLNLLQF